MLVERLTLGTLNPTKFVTEPKSRVDIPYAYKFADGNIGVGEDKVITLPLYMAAFAL